MAQNQQKAILITGGGKRIGQAIALHLADSGFTIALHYHQSRPEAENTRNLIRNKGGVCELFNADLVKDHQILSLIPQVRKKFPGLCVLINNASIFNKGTLTESSIAAFDQHFQINLRAPYLLTQQFAHFCPKGQIINLLDRDIVKNKVSHFAYSLSKKSLADLTELSALALAPGIRVNAVAPGAVLPPPGKSLADLRNMAKNIPLKKTAQPADIARAVEFLIKSPQITGQILFVDGGEHLR